MAFVFAGIIFVATLLISICILFANGMSDAPSVQGIPVLPTFIGGCVIAALVAGSHWLHFSW